MQTHHFVGEAHTQAFLNHNVTRSARASALHIVLGSDASTIARGRTLPRRAGVSSIAQWRRCKSIVDTTRIVVLPWLFLCRGVARPTRHASTSIVAATPALRLRSSCLHLWFSCNSVGCRGVLRIHVLCSAPIVPLATIAQNTRQQHLHHTVPMLCSSTRYLQRTVSRVLRFPLSVLASPLIVIARAQFVSAVPEFVGAARSCDNGLACQSSNTM